MCDKKLDSRGEEPGHVGRSASVREGTTDLAPFNLCGLLAGAAVCLLVGAIAWAMIAWLVDLAVSLVAP